MKEKQRSKISLTVSRGFEQHIASNFTTRQALYVKILTRRGQINGKESNQIK